MRAIRPKEKTANKPYTACLDLVIQGKNKEVETHVYIVAQPSDTHNVSNMWRWYERNEINIKKNATRFFTPAALAAEKGNQNTAKEWPGFLLADCEKQFGSSVANATNDNITILAAEPFIVEGERIKMGKPAALNGVVIISVLFKEMSWSSRPYGMLFSIDAGDKSDGLALKRTIEDHRADIEEMIGKIEAAEDFFDMVDHELDLYEHLKTISGGKEVEIILPDRVIR